LFLSIYAQVCTRCFGYGLESTSMIPMADNLNHSSVEVTTELMCVSLHPEGDRDIEYYRIARFLNDYTPAFKEHGWSDDDITKKKLNIKGRFNHDIYKMNQEALSIANIRANLSAKGSQIWKIPFLLDTFDEDNDSSEEEGDNDDDGMMGEDGQRHKQIRVRNGHGLEFFLSKEKEFLAK